MLYNIYMNINERIYEKVNSLTPKENEVADYILDNKDTQEIHNFTVNELSNRVGVDQDIVMNLVKKIGFDSFSEFRITLRREFYNRKADTYYFENEINRLCEETMSQDVISEYEEIAECVWDAKNIYFYGIGSSSFVSETFAYYMFRTGKNTRIIHERHEFNMVLSMANKDDVLFVISRSGDTTEILEGIDFAIDHCNVVLITQNRSQSLKESVDFTIYLPEISDKIENLDFMWVIVQLCTISKWFNFYITKHENEIKTVQDKVTASITMFHESLR